MPGLTLEAYHTADIQYVFPGWHGGPEGFARPLNRKQQELSEQLISAWANFARTGNPNGSGSRPWPRYTAVADAPGWAIQDLPGLSSATDERYALDHQCQFWNAVAQDQ
jgi:para-nitrobenzyl esterase